MKKLCAWVLLFVVAGALIGCKSTHSGSREFVPGQGWKYTD